MKVLFSFSFFIIFLAGGLVPLTPSYDLGNTTYLEELNQEIIPEWNVSSTKGSLTVKMTLVGLPDVVCQKNTRNCWTRDYDQSRLIYKIHAKLPNNKASRKYYLDSFDVTGETYTFSEDQISLTTEYFATYRINKRSKSTDENGNVSYSWEMHDYEKTGSIKDTILKPDIYIPPEYEIDVTVTNNTQGRTLASDMFTEYMFGYRLVGTGTITYKKPLCFEEDRIATETTNAHISVLRVKPYYTIERQSTMYIGVITPYDEPNVHGIGFTTYEEGVVGHNVTIDQMGDLGPYGWSDVETNSVTVTYFFKEYSGETETVFLTALAVYLCIAATIVILLFIILPRLVREYL